MHGILVAWQETSALNMSVSLNATGGHLRMLIHDFVCRKIWHYTKYLNAVVHVAVQPLSSHAACLFCMSLLYAVARCTVSLSWINMNAYNVKCEYGLYLQARALWGQNPIISAFGWFHLVPVYESACQSLASDWGSRHDLHLAISRVYREKLFSVSTSPLWTSLFLPSAMCEC